MRVRVRVKVRVKVRVFPSPKLNTHVEIEKLAQFACRWYIL